MKKKGILFIFLILCLVLIGCGSSNKNYNQISFYIDDEIYMTEKVASGSILDEPEAPYKSFSYFNGWVTADDVKYEFDESVYSNINLYASYSINYADLINEITTNLIKANVQVMNTTYNKSGFLGIQTDVETSYGSGAIFNEQNGKYYLMTNNHVLYNSKNYQDISIKDYLGNTYKASVVTNSLQSSYDLAILFFTKTDELAVFTLATANEVVNSEVVAIGQPNLQMNAITLGIIEQYQIGRVENSKSEINIDFPAIRHTAFTARGSSGGALLNTKLELIGIHYAGQDTTNFSDVCFAVPIEKILEYLDLYF